MAEDSDEDYFFFGTPLPEPEDLKPHQRQVAEKAGQLKTLPVWKQEVTDEQGRKRFHGAFTGGFSAGFYNTVGSKEGWAPAQFVSSRKKRAEKLAQAAEDYMDEDEKEVLRSQALAASADFDTFGGTASEVARRQADSEAQGRPSAIPGPVPDELLVPAVDSVGVKLLKKMGWRPGKGVGPKHEVAAAEKRREARRAMIALAQSYGAEVPPGLDEEPGEAPEEDADAIEVPKTTPIFVLQPKKDFYGLGFDPLKGAPEFRAAKRAKTEGNKGPGKGGNLFRPQAGKVGGGFGVGALEEVGEEDEDVYATELPMDQELLEEEEQEEVARGKAKASEKDLSTKLEFRAAPKDMLPGFRVGSGEGVEVQEWFAPPTVPKGFVPRHVFVTEGLGFGGAAKVKEVAPPADEELRKRIETLAAFVANSGEKLEEIAKERNKGDPAFGFLFGAAGKDYYAWKKSELIGDRGSKVGAKAEDPGPVDRGGFRKPAEFGGRSGRDRAPRMTAEERGRLLGEKPLPSSEDAKSVVGADQKAGSSREAIGVPGERPKSVMDMIAPEDRARLQGALASTFTKGASQDMGYDNRKPVKPFAGDPAKQARYEAFLQERSVGGLRRPGRNGGMTEEERAREKEEFETTAQASDQGIRPAPPQPPPTNPALAFLGDRFAPAGETPTTAETVPGSSRGSIMDVVAAMQSSAAAAVAKKFPRREVEEWRPAPLLCRRFNILDPYSGKAPAPAKPKSKTDSLALFMPQFGQDVKPELAPGGTERLALPPPPKIKEGEKVEVYVPEKEFEAGLETEANLVSGIDKPIDLFKAIFSDSEDESEALEGLGVLGRPAEKAAEAATAALNRHAASEFLAQFGVELPPPPPAAPPPPAVLFRPKKERNKGEGPKSKKGPEAGAKKKVSGLLSFGEEVGEEERTVQVSKAVTKDVNRLGKREPVAEAGNRGKNEGSETVSEKADDNPRLAVAAGDAKKDEGEDGRTGGIKAGGQEGAGVGSGTRTEGGAPEGVDLWAEIFEGTEKEEAQPDVQQPERGNGVETTQSLQITGEQLQREREWAEEHAVEKVRGPEMGPLSSDKKEDAGTRGGLETATGAERGKNGMEGASGLSGRDERDERHKSNGRVSEDGSSDDERRRMRREKERARNERERRTGPNVNEGASSESDEREGQRRRRKRKKREERRQRERRRKERRKDGSSRSEERDEKAPSRRRSQEAASEEGDDSDKERERKPNQRHKQRERRESREKGRRKGSNSHLDDHTETRGDDKKSQRVDRSG